MSATGTSAGVWSSWPLPGAENFVAPIEVYVRDVSLTFLPSGFGFRRFRPYVGIMVSSKNYRWMTPKINRWNKGLMRFAAIFTMDADLQGDNLRVELWHARRFRRDVLMATAMVPLNDLKEAANHGMALDRWIPLTMYSRDSDPLQPPKTIGLAHLLVRLMTPPPNIQAVPTVQTTSVVPMVQTNSAGVVTQSNQMSGAGIMKSPLATGQQGQYQGAMGQQAMQPSMAAYGGGQQYGTPVASSGRTSMFSPKTSAPVTQQQHFQHDIVEEHNAASMPLLSTQGQGGGHMMPSDYSQGQAGGQMMQSDYNTSAMPAQSNAGFGGQSTQSSQLEQAGMRSSMGAQQAM